MPVFEPFDMTDEQKRALKASLSHWEDNVNLREGAPRRFRPEDCECCRTWLTDTRDCTGCPVARFTGAPGCCDTPCEDKDIRMHSPIEKFREASKRELDFLRALLEERFEDARKLCEPYKWTRWTF